MSNLAMKRSKRFLSSKYPSTEIAAISKPSQGGDFFHFSHPYHPVVQINLPYLFTCSGCKEYGAGKRYRCQICEYDLHDFCALAPPSLYNHPFHPQHPLVFSTKPGGGFVRSRCDICGQASKGYAFRCSSCGFEMHPCCATMHGQMNFPTHQHPLILLPPLGDFVKCEVCHRKRSGPVYSCLACGYHMHAACAKQMVNGLYMHGFKPPEKSNMLGLGAAARVATQAVAGLISGLIEGIGEGIGGALMDNIGRGRSLDGRQK